MKADLKVVSDERPYDSDNPVMKQTSPEFTLGKGIVTITYEVSPYPPVGTSHCEWWGRVDGVNDIPNLYPKDHKPTPYFGIVGQPWKVVDTYELTESPPDDMRFYAWLAAPSACQSMAICQQGTQLAASQKLTIEFQSAEGSATRNQDGQKTAKDWNRKGNDLFKQGKHAEAIEAYDEAIRLDPNYATAWSNKCAVLNKQGKYNEAIEACSESIYLDPEYSGAWTNKGNVLYKQGKYSDAIDYYEYAIKLDPDLGQAWYNKGLALKKLGLTKEANEAFAKAKELGYPSQS